MSKIILLLILAVAIVGVIEISKIPGVETFGLAGYNDLGYSGVTNSSTTVATSTTTEVLSANGARIYARIGNTDATNAIYCKMINATPTTMIYEGITIVAKDSYVIGVDNLWKGKIWCIAASSAVVVSTIEK